jgi:hypothetical protein
VSQSDALRQVLYQSDGAVNETAVGKPAQVLARMAKINIPEQTRILISPVHEKARRETISFENPFPVLSWEEVKNWREGRDRALDIMRLSGMGGLVAIHADNEKIVSSFAQQKGIRFAVVNGMSSLAGIGIPTGLVPFGYDSQSELGKKEPAPADGKPKEDSEPLPGYWETLQYAVRGFHQDQLDPIAKQVLDKNHGGSGRVLPGA